jgi:20S proteasome alpha/beta subunit
MTIALGLLTSEGIVIAADSQETDESAGTKEDVNKIAFGFQLRAENDEGGAIAVSGSGGAAYLDYIFEEIIMSFRTSAKENVAAFGERLKRLVKEYYREHVVPYAQDPRLRAPDVQLIVGAQRRGEKRLWITEGSTVGPRMYGAVGSGQAHALRTLKRFFNWRDTEGGQLLAALAVFEAKRYDLYCGKNTSIVSLVDNFMQTPTTEDIYRWEKAFTEYSAIEAEMRRYCLSFRTKAETTEEPDVMLERLMSSLRSLRSRVASARPTT